MSTKILIFFEFSKLSEEKSNNLIGNRDFCNHKVTF